MPHPGCGLCASLPTAKPIGLSRSIKKLQPAFVSANQWPVDGNWLMVAKDNARYVLLKDGVGLTCRSTRHARLVEISSADSNASKEVQDLEVDLVCKDPAITLRDGFSDVSCRSLLSEVNPVLQEFLLATLPENARLFAIVGKFEGPGLI